MSPREELEERLKLEQKAEFFTDFYVEAGSLAADRPSYSFGNGRAVFDLASLTKALVTGPLVHHYVSSQQLSLQDPISRWGTSGWQKAFSSELMNLTPAELLSHRSGLPAWRNFWMGRLDEHTRPSPLVLNPLIPEVFKRGIPLGEKADVYSDVGYILLGYALEGATGQSLSKLWSDFIASLGLSPKHLGYSHQLQGDQWIVASAHCALRGRLLRGEVHDENAAALGGAAGHAGLFGSGEALGQYLRTLASSIEGERYLAANVNELALHTFEGLLGMRRGNGTSAALFAGGRGLGHLGFTGTAFWIDPDFNRYAIFLSNRVISGRVNPHITAVRRAVFGLLDELT